MKPAFLFHILVGSHIYYYHYRHHHSHHSSSYFVSVYDLLVQYKSMYIIFFGHGLKMLHCRTVRNCLQTVFVHVM